MVAVANGNTISGLAINNLNGTGISQSNAAVTITNLTITNNTISSSSSVTQVGVSLNNVAGQMVIDQNEIGIERSGGMALVNANINNAYYAITNNSIAPSSSQAALSFTYTNSSGITTETERSAVGRRGQPHTSQQQSIFWERGRTLYLYEYSPSPFPIGNPRKQQ